MAASDAKSGITGFFESYRAAFERYDAASLVDCFVYPSYIVSDAEQVVLIPMGTREDCLVGIEQVLGLHRKLGVASGRYRRFQITELSSRLASLHLQYELHDGAGRTLYDFIGFYTLVFCEGAWRIATISHNQIPRLIDCVARRQAATS